MKDKKNILIIILSILLVITVGYIVYSKLNSKNIDNCSKTENNNIENNNSNKNNQNQTSDQSEYNIVGEAYNGIKVIKNTNADINPKNGDPLELVEKVILPKILKDTDTTKSINKKILDDNKWAISTIEKGLQTEDNP